MNAKHTATPWHVEKRGEECFNILGTNEDAGKVDVCYSGRFLTIAQGMDDREDADFIVRAVNAHDELVAALRAMIFHWPHEPFGAPGAEDAFIRARAALSKAEEA